MFPDGNAKDPLSVIIRMANTTALLPWLAFDPVSQTPFRQPAAFDTSDLAIQFAVADQASATVQMFDLMPILMLLLD